MLSNLSYIIAESIKASFEDIQTNGSSHVKEISWQYHTEPAPIVTLKINVGAVAAQQLLNLLVDSERADSEITVEE